MPVGITLVVEFIVTAGISQLFQKLVKDFKCQCWLQKADRLGGILSL